MYKIGHNFPVTIIPVYPLNIFKHQSTNDSSAFKRVRPMRTKYTSQFVSLIYYLIYIKFIALYINQMFIYT